MRSATLLSAPAGSGASTDTPQRPAGFGTRLARRARRVPWLVYPALLPLAVVLGWFMYYPAANGIFRSTWDWNPAGESTFVGIDNFRTMMDDEIWWSSFRNLGFIFVFHVASWILPIAAAELLISLRSERAQFVYRTLLLVPMAFPSVVTALVWGFMYHPNNGVINKSLEGMGLGALAQNWLGDPDLALWSLLFVGFPFVAGLPFLVFYSSLRNIPSEIFEAAALDGVGRIRRILSIDLPLLARQVRLLLILGVIVTLQYGLIAFVLTGGGPNNATMVPVIRILNVAFQGQDWGYAAALSTTLFLITLMLSVLVASVRGKSDSTTNVRGL